MTKINYKEHNFKSGIYKIYWPISGRFYFGQSRNLHGRMRAHISDMSRNLHQNEVIQNSFNKYGLPEFHCVAFCPRSYLDDVEQLFLTLHMKNKKCCNIAPTPNNGNMAISTRKKLSIIRTDRKLDPTHKNKISTGLLTAYQNGRERPNMQGENNHFYKKNHTQKAKDAMSKAKKIMYVGDANPNSKIIFDTYNGIFYTTIQEFAENINITSGCFMHRVRRGKYKHLIFI